MSTLRAPDILFAKVYDDLVDSRSSNLPFIQEASLVAKFTRLYVQNLFDLSENQFNHLMKKHCQLHLKADRYERLGKSPYLALEQQVLKQDTLGKILERYAMHLGSLDCILDVKTTAALVHHLVSFKPSADLPLNVIGCELGAGTGILAVAGSIPFLHNGNVLTIHTFEKSTTPREDASRIFKILKRESKFKDYLEIHFHVDDVTTEKPFQIIKEAEKESGPLALWISETFGYQSKKPIIDKKAETCEFIEPYGVIPYSNDLEKTYDPLPYVLNLSCQHFDGFLQKMASGDIAAFPDIAKPQVIIDGLKSAMISPDGVWRKLHEIGQPYDMLPPCITSRWHLEKKTAQNIKKKKKRKLYCR